ncbi:zinc finger (ccch type) motif-containing protein [Cyclospora cayetanensis]|uniref:Zinc finger (Ccch type) motif-containing protein n=1 Tax=Cyclospora cayetanensis TaxID=88456 RepID=A0A1D3CVE9_9EIME|nr:zinc finger (ccch type) motif-containing protein [Cyclospora cayetanensis]
MQRGASVGLVQIFPAVRPPRISLTGETTDLEASGALRTAVALAAPGATGMQLEARAATGAVEGMAQAARGDAGVEMKALAPPGTGEGGPRGGPMAPTDGGGAALTEIAVSAADAGKPPPLRVEEPLDLFDCDFLFGGFPVCASEEAHGGKGIRCCIVNPAASELFTGGKDKKLMRWQISQPAAQVSPGTAEGGDLDSTGEPLLALNCLTCTDMGAEVCCLKLLGGALFAGLGDGRIKVFLANGEVKELTGHEKSVYSLLLVEGVLVSGDWGGCIRFWRFEEPQQTFNAIHALQVEGSICCLQTADVTLPQPPGGATPPAAGSSAPPTTRKVLWAGGTALSIIDLQSLQVLRVLDVSDVKGNGPPLVLALLPFNDCLLVGFASGAICAYTADGERQYCFSSDYLSAMEGLMSPRGPVLVYGGRRSSFRVLKVPEFEEGAAMRQHGGSAAVDVESKEGVLNASAVSGNYKQARRTTFRLSLPVVCTYNCRPFLFCPIGLLLFGFLSHVRGLMLLPIAAAYQAREPGNGQRGTDLGLINASRMGSKRIA